MTGRTSLDSLKQEVGVSKGASEIIIAFFGEGLNKITVSGRFEEDY